MKQYQRRPYAVEAMQWDGTLSGIEALSALFPQLITESIIYVRPSTVHWAIKGYAKTVKGDWVVRREIEGEQVVVITCDEYFVRDYEPIEPT